MTYEEAVAMKVYGVQCNCGGYRAGMSGRNPDDPHMTWCAQYKIFHEHREALKRGPAK